MSISNYEANTGCQHCTSSGDRQRKDAKALSCQHLFSHGEEGHSMTGALQGASESRASIRDWVKVNVKADPKGLWCSLWSLKAGIDTLAPQPPGDISPGASFALMERKTH